MPPEAAPPSASLVSSTAESAPVPDVLSSVLGEMSLAPKFENEPGEVGRAFMTRRMRSVKSKNGTARSPAMERSTKKTRSILHGYISEPQISPTTPLTIGNTFDVMEWPLAGAVLPTSAFSLVLVGLPRAFESDDVRDLLLRCASSAAGFELGHVHVSRGSQCTASEAQFWTEASAVEASRAVTAAVEEALQWRMRFDQERKEQKKEKKAAGAEDRNEAAMSLASEDKSNLTDTTGEPGVASTVHEVSSLRVGHVIWNMAAATLRELRVVEVRSGTGVGKGVQKWTGPSAVSGDDSLGLGSVETFDQRLERQRRAEWKVEWEQRSRARVEVDMLRKLRGVRRTKKKGRGKARRWEEEEKAMIEALTVPKEKSIFRKFEREQD